MNPPSTSPLRIHTPDLSRLNPRSEPLVINLLAGAYEFSILDGVADIPDPRPADTEYFRHGGRVLAVRVLAPAVSLRLIDDASGPAAPAG